MQFFKFIRIRSGLGMKNTTTVNFIVTACECKTFREKTLKLFFRSRTGIRIQLFCAWEEIDQ